MKLPCFSLLLLLSFSLGAQNPTEGNPDYLEQLANLGPNSLSVQGFDNRYEGVVGSAFLWEKWRTAQILFTGKEHYSREVEANLDLVSQQLFFRLSSLRGGYIPTRDIHAVRFGPADAPEALFVTHLRGEVEGDRNEEIAFYQVLHQGDYTLLKHLSKYLLKANFKGGYSPDRRHDEYLARQAYFLRDSAGVFHKVKLRRKTLEKVLPRQSDRIRKYWKREQLKQDDEQSIILLLSLLEKEGDG